MISFIVPARNEEANIGRCIESVGLYLPPLLAHEVIVVDNGSQDRTVEIAERLGAKVVHSAATSIAGVRNDGVAQSRGWLLVFLDADCALTERWSRSVGQAVRTIEEDPLVLTGSHPIPPTEPNINLWKYWFLPLFQHTRPSHLGSAHLLCSRALFDSVGGFNSLLQTGEDYEFCQDTLRAGAKLTPNTSLEVIHFDFPKTLTAFFRRERWHGRGGTTSMSILLSSPVVLISVLFTAFAATAIVSLLIGNAVVCGLSVAAGLLLLSLAVARKFPGSSFRQKMYATPVFAVYFFARFLSAIDGVIGYGTTSKKASRSST